MELRMMLREMMGGSRVYYSEWYELAADGEAVMFAVADDSATVRFYKVYERDGGETYELYERVHLIDGWNSRSRKALDRLVGQKLAEARDAAAKRRP